MIDMIFENENTCPDSWLTTSVANPFSLPLRPNFESIPLNPAFEFLLRSQPSSYPGLMTSPCFAVAISPLYSRISVSTDATTPRPSISTTSPAEYQRDTKEQPRTNWHTALGQGPITNDPRDSHMLIKHITVPSNLARVTQTWIPFPFFHCDFLSIPLVPTFKFLLHPFVLMTRPHVGHLSAAVHIHQSNYPASPAGRQRHPTTLGRCQED